MISILVQSKKKKSNDNKMTNQNLKREKNHKNFRNVLCLDTDFVSFFSP